MTTKMNQIPLFNLPQELEKPPIVTFTIPEIHYDSLQQLSFALQNRDENALQFLLSDEINDDFLKSKQDFIQRYLKYCNILEKKHGAIYIQIQKGKCTSYICPNRKKVGLSVTVNTVTGNKHLWVFNVAVDKDSHDCLDMARCIEFSVCKEHV